MSFRGYKLKDDSKNQEPNTRNCLRAKQISRITSPGFSHRNSIGGNSNVTYLTKKFVNSNFPQRLPSKDNFAGTSLSRRDYPAQNQFQRNSVPTSTQHSLFGKVVNKIRTGVVSRDNSVSERNQALKERLQKPKNSNLSPRDTLDNKKIGFCKSQLHFHEKKNFFESVNPNRSYSPIIDYPDNVKGRYHNPIAPSAQSKV